MFNLKKVGQMAINRWMDTHRWWSIPAMSYRLAIRKGQTTDAWSTGESQKQDVLWEKPDKERFCILLSQETSTHTQNLPTAKGSRCVAVEGGRGVTANSLWQIFLGCWENYLDWSGHISVCQTLHFKWVHFMYVNSSSIKLIHEGEKGGHKYFNSSPWPSR